MVEQSSTARQDNVELECLEDLDQQTAHSADALLRRDPPQLTRLTSSDREDDLEFDPTAADHEDDDDDDEEEPSGQARLKHLPRIKGFKDSTALNRTHISQLRGVSCHMGSHSVTCHPTQVNAPHLNLSQ